MSAAEVVIIEVGPGDDPMPEFERAWARGARALPLSRTMPAAGRAEIVARVQALHAPAEPGLVLPTSGSTGVPRLIDLSLDAMIASARLGSTVIPFGAGDVWHASLAPSHIGGVMILMRARVLGGGVRFGPQPRVWGDLAGCTHVSLVAAQLARLLEDPSPVPASLRAVMLGGGPSAQALRDRAIARGVPLFATYGLTETSSQVATALLSAGDPATLAGAPLPGASIRIHAATGEILVDGPMLARGEIVDGALAPLQRPLHTRDAGQLDSDGRLHVVGRLDSMFISGGKNIHPETIERALCAIAGVRSACVVPVPHAQWGARPIAFVDLASPAGDLAARVGDLLEPHLVPDEFLCMPDDERSSLKPSRQRLQARLSAGERFDRLG